MNVPPVRAIIRVGTKALAHSSSSGLNHTTSTAITSSPSPTCSHHINFSRLPRITLLILMMIVLDDQNHSTICNTSQVKIKRVEKASQYPFHSQSSQSNHLSKWLAEFDRVQDKTWRVLKICLRKSGGDVWKTRTCRFSMEQRVDAQGDEGSWWSSSTH